MSEDREGMYAEWEWCPVRKCWRYEVPMEIFPHDDGTFSAASAEVWLDGLFTSFEEAELAVLDISNEQADRDREHGHAQGWA